MLKKKAACVFLLNWHEDDEGEDKGGK